MNAGRAAVLHGYRPSAVADPAIIKNDEMEGGGPLVESLLSVFE